MVWEKVTFTKHSNCDWFTWKKKTFLKAIHYAIWKFLPNAKYRIETVFNLAIGPWCVILPLANHELRKCFHFEVCISAKLMIAFGITLKTVSECWIVHFFSRPTVLWKFVWRLGYCQLVLTADLNLASVLFLC